MPNHPMVRWLCEDCDEVLSAFAGECGLCPTCGLMQDAPYPEDVPYLSDDESALAVVR